MGEGAEDGFRTVGRAPVRLDEMNGLRERGLRNLREARPGFLKRDELDTVADGPFPSLDPAPAKAAVPVENENGPRRFPIS